MTLRCKGFEPAGMVDGDEVRDMSGRKDSDRHPESLVDVKQASVKDTAIQPRHLRDAG